MSSSSSLDDDNFIAYGTPLEPLEEDEIPTKKARFSEDQFVKDKQGRRRFHGAFTGGFSAGFFNTVGSLEGWKPSTFKSSKNDKQKWVHQKPEDYMDEEDVTTFGIAPVVLRTSRDYSTVTEKSSKTGNNESNVEFFLFNNLLKPVRETMGLKLLMKMGWKPGQGIGPRSKKKERKKISEQRKKIYGCKDLGEESEECDSDGDSEWSVKTYAPNDYELYVMSPKDNLFGLGYVGLPKHKVISESNRGLHDRQDYVLNNSHKKFSIRGQAFGVGAFEDEDEDIYSWDDISQYDRVLTGEVKQKEEETIKALHGDAFSTIDGFTLQSKKHNKLQYRLPIIPKNFKCHHRVKKSRFDCGDDKIGIYYQNLKAAEKQERKLSNSKFMEGETNGLKNNGFQRRINDQGEKTEKLKFNESSDIVRLLTEMYDEKFLAAQHPDDPNDPLKFSEKRPDDKEDDCQVAAEKKMYGQLTRNVEEWSPCPLLSRRFNVPEIRDRSFHKPEKKEKTAGATLSSLMADHLKSFAATDFSKDVLRQSEEKGATKDANNVKSDEKIDKTDLFRAIFLADDDDNCDRNDKEDFGGDFGRTGFEENLINANKNVSPPRGIFEDIDLETLRQTNDHTEDAMDDAEVEAREFYGPRVPDEILFKRDGPFTGKADNLDSFSKSRSSSTPDNLSWVEKNVDPTAAKKTRKKEKKNRRKNKSKRKSKRSKHSK